MVVVGIHTAYKNEFSIVLILLGMLYSRRNPKQYLGIFDFEKERITLLLYIWKLHIWEKSCLVTIYCSEKSCSALSFRFPSLISLLIEKWELQRHTREVSSNTKTLFQSHTPIPLQTAAVLTFNLPPSLSLFRLQAQQHESHQLITW